MMHYYKRNIGDYAKKAGRLSMLEHGAYTLLIDACYDRERFPTLDEALDWCWARDEDEKQAVMFVLGKFFELQDGVYVQNRIAEEIAAYVKNAETNKRIATEREQKRKSGARTVHEPSPYVNEPPPNQEPRTINQEPRTINQEQITINQKENKPQAARATRSVISKPDCVDEVIWNDWLQHRKLKKAVVTETVLKAIEREALKASMTLQDALETMCSRGWTGFKSDWMINGNAQSIKKQKNLGAFDEFLGEQNVIEFNNQTGEWK